MFKFNKDSGQAAKLLLVLAVVILVAIVITFLVIKMAEKPAEPVVTEEPAVPLPVYEQDLGNIKFIFISARDLGKTLKSTDAVNDVYSSQKDVTTKEKFIEVNIGAKNMGKENIENAAWSIGNIIDSEGRNFEALDDYKVNAWLPTINLCGSLLKPAFNPTSCIKMYEVAEKSNLAELKIEVKTGKDNAPTNYSAGKIDTALIDLIVR